MTLFVVVTHSKQSGKEYLEASDEVEGYEEFSAALRHADFTRRALGEGWNVYVGKVVPVGGEEQASDTDPA